jgi:hypothetical protein
LIDVADHRREAPVFAAYVGASKFPPQPNFAADAPQPDAAFARR